MSHTSPSHLKVKADSLTDEWDNIYRCFFLFDTSPIDDADNIDSAVFSLVFDTTAGWFLDELSPAGAIALVECTIASNTAIASSDFEGTVGNTTRQATDKTLASLTVDDTTYNDWTLNATGRGNISLTSITKLGARIASDADDTEPTWSADDQTYVAPIAAENSGTSEDPKLEVTHSAAAPSLLPRNQGLHSAILAR